MSIKTILLEDMKIYTDFDFAEFPDPAIVDKDIKLEYIKALINLSQEDKKSVYPYVLFNVGAIVFIFGNMLSSLVALAFVWRLLTILGILLLALSSIYFFWYWRKIHKCHINLVSCIPGLNIVKAKDLWTNLWMENKTLFKAGLVLMILGIILSSIMFDTLI
jgi:hypothetical protein